MTVRPGTVYLVGAGPGDPGLITVRGMELLRRADVVVHDRLVGQALLEEALVTARHIDVGKRPGAQSFTQEQINEILVEHAQRGEVVVRLKGGDPFVFGRGWEEAQACARAGVPCEVVPGVSSAIAGPASAGIPVTARGSARSFAVIAAETESGPIGAERLKAAAGADTLVVLMGMRSIGSIVQTLLDAGRDPCTPAAVIEQATLPGQRVVRAPLARLADVAAEAHCAAPAVIVIGPTAAAATDELGVLTGRRIVVTRPRHAAHELSARLRAHGAEIIECPLIRIRPIDPAESFLEGLGRYDWVVFTSRHGVRGFRRALERAGGDARRFGSARIAAVGPVTARELAQWGLRADLCPDEYRADALVRALIAQSPGQVLFPCGTLALDVVADGLSRAGAIVDRLLVYETIPVPPEERTATAIARGVDAVLFASPSAVRAMAELAHDLHGAAIVCIGPTTAAEAQRAGFGRIVTAAVHTDAGLVAATAECLGPPGTAAGGGLFIPVAAPTKETVS